METEMNKRIQELAEQAGWDNHHAQFDTRIEKFAELIVRECINKVNEVGYKSANNISTDDTELFKNVLKSHFGVKE
jgi:hypothetical protein